MTRFRGPTSHSRGQNAVPTYWHDFQRWEETHADNYFMYALINCFLSNCTMLIPKKPSPVIFLKIENAVLVIPIFCLCLEHAERTVVWFSGVAQKVSLLLLLHLVQWFIKWGRFRETQEKRGRQSVEREGVADWATTKVCNLGCYSILQNNVVFQAYSSCTWTPAGLHHHRLSSMRHSEAFLFKMFRNTPTA